MEVIILFTLYMRKLMFTLFTLYMRHGKKKQLVQGYISNKWQNQDSSLGLANFDAHPHNDYALLALLVIEGTIVEARNSFLIQLTSVLNPSPLLWSNS